RRIDVCWWSVKWYGLSGRFSRCLCNRPFFRLLALQPRHRDLLLCRRRMFRSSVIAPRSREPREPDREASPGADRSPGSRVNRAHREFGTPNLEDGGRLEPDVGLEPRVDSNGFAVPTRGLESVRQREQRLIVEARPKLARRPEQILLLVVCGHEERSVGARAFPPARERADDHEVDRIAQRRAVLLLELDPLSPSRARVVRTVQRLRHEAFASRVKGLVDASVGLFN